MENRGKIFSRRHGAVVTLSELTSTTLGYDREPFVENIYTKSTIQSERVRPPLRPVLIDLCTYSGHFLKPKALS